MLLAAAGANVLNAWVQSPAHRSIGASTAVFAALGLLVTYTWRRGYLRDTPWRARIAPIVAGLGLLAFTGTAGENTDLGRALVRLHRGARVLGSRSRASRPSSGSSNARVQRLGGAVAALVLVAAWAVGLARRGLAQSSAFATSSRKSRSFAMDSASRAFSV